MVRIEEHGERPWELNGWNFHWEDEYGAKALWVGPVRVGLVTPAMLEAASPIAPLVIEVDWVAITKHLRG